MRSVLGFPECAVPQLEVIASPIGVGEECPRMRVPKFQNGYLLTGFERYRFVVVQRSSPGSPSGRPGPAMDVRRRCRAVTGGRFHRDSRPQRSPSGLLLDLVGLRPTFRSGCPLHQRRQARLGACRPGFSALISRSPVANGIYVHATSGGSAHLERCSTAPVRRFAKSGSLDRRAFSRIAVSPGSREAKSRFLAGNSVAQRAVCRTNEIPLPVAGVSDKVLDVNA
jgi:hypothetical protein